MSKPNIDKNELEDLKTLCDYILFDQFIEYASFQQFEKSFSFFYTPDVGVSLEKVFKEICGEKKKYITFRRLLKAFNLYKTSPKNVSKDLKKFFDYYFKKIQKFPEEEIGKETPNSKFLVSSKFDRCSCITKILVLENRHGTIQGFKLQYDDTTYAYLYDKDIQNNLYVKIEIHLPFLNAKNMDQESAKQIDFTNQYLFRDAIMNVFGTILDGRIEFFGIKCRSGKVCFTGSPVGEPFLYGDYDEQIHYLNINVENGIRTFQPYTKETGKGNESCRLKFKDLTMDYINKEEIIKDEKILKNLTDKDEIDKFIMAPICDDNYFYEQEYENEEGEINGESLRDVVSMLPRQYQLDGEVNNNMTADELIGEVADDIDDIPVLKGGCRDSGTKKKIILGKKEPRVNYELNETDPLEFKSAQNQNMPRKLIKKGDEHIRKQGKLVRQKERLDFENDEDYEVNDKEQEMEKFKKEIEEQFGKELTEENKEYFIKKSQFKDDDDDEEEEDEPLAFKSGTNGECSNINLEENEEEKKEKEKFTNFINNYFPEQEKTKKAQNNWKKMANYLNTLRIDTLLQKMYKVIHYGILLTEDMEEQDEEKKLSKEKIEEYQNFLQENSNIGDFLDPDKNDEKKAKEEQKRKEKEDDKKEYSINDLNNKIASIENVFDEVKDQDKQEELNYLYICYKKGMNDLIEEGEQTLKEEMIQSKNINVDDMYENERKLRGGHIQNFSFNVRERINQIENNIKKNKIELQKREDSKKNKIQLQKKDSKKNKIELQKKEDSQSNNKKEFKKSIKDFLNNKNKPIKIYRKQNIDKTEEEWVDDLFVAQNDCLCPIDEKGNFDGSAFDGFEQEDVEDWDQIKFTKIDNIFGDKDYGVMENGATENDIIQGSLSDCYFLSSLASLTKHQKFLESLVFINENNNERVYGISLRINGIWKVVLVDDYIPCIPVVRSRIRYNTPMFCRYKSNNVWSMLFEKAWAKINGSYIAIGTGGFPTEVFPFITNAYSRQYSLGNFKLEKLWEKLKLSCQNKFIICAGTGVISREEGKSTGLIQGHAYTVKNVFELKDKTRLVQIRNPYGDTEWKLDWSDKSDKWNKENSKEVNRTEDTRDGIFFMSLDDFVKYFRTLYICEFYENYKYNYRRIKKNVSKLGPVISKIKITKNKTNVYFQMFQKNSRLIQKDGTYPTYAFGYMILMDNEYKYIDGNMFIDNNSMCINVELNEGVYYLLSDINYRYMTPDSIHGYTLTTYSNCDIPLEEEKKLKPSLLISECLWDLCNSNSEPIKNNSLQAISEYRLLGCGLNKDYPFNQPFDVVIIDNTGIEPVDAVIKITHPELFEIYTDMQYKKEKDEIVMNHQIERKANSYFILYYHNYIKEGKKIKPDKSQIKIVKDYGEGKDPIVEKVFKNKPQSCVRKGEKNESNKVLIYDDAELKYLGIENKFKEPISYRILLTGREFEEPDSEETPNLKTGELEGKQKDVFEYKDKSSYRFKAKSCKVIFEKI